MSIRHGFAFPDRNPDNAPSEGDGASNRPPSQPLSTAGALDTQISRSHGSESAYRASQAASSSVMPGGSSGFELEHTDDAVEDTELSTTGTVPRDSNVQSAATTGGTDKLVQSTAAGDVQRDTGQSGGRVVI
jgi:hypothetical protein